MLLSELATELVDKVSQNLDREDICNLRLVSKDLRDKSYHQFGIEYFGHRQWLLTREGLHGLLDISKHEIFGRCVREVKLCWVAFPDSAMVSILKETPSILPQKKLPKRALRAKAQTMIKQPDKQPDNPKELRKQRRSAFRRHVSNTNTLRKQGHDLHMLVEALKICTGLHSVTLDGSVLVHPRVNDSRSLSPWGSTKLTGDTGLSLGALDMDRHWELLGSSPGLLGTLMHGVALTLGAIAKTGKNLKGSFTVHVLPIGITIPKSSTHRRRSTQATSARTFSEEDFPSLRSAFVDLKSVDFQQTWWNISHLRSDISVDYQWLRRFLPMFASAESFQFSGQARPLNALVQADYKNSFEYLHLHLTEHLPLLRRLELISLQFKIKQLVRILSAHADTLQHVGLSHLRSVGEHESMMNVLCCLRNLPKLKSVAFDSLYEDYSYFEFYLSSGQIASTDDLHLQGPTLENFQIQLEDAIQNTYEMLSPGSRPFNLVY